MLYILLLLPIAVWAQGRSGLQVGLQGGTNMRLGGGQTPRMGMNGGLDVNYTYMASVGYASTVGFRIGVGLENQRTYMRAPVRMQMDMSLVSMSGGEQSQVPIHYTVTATAQYEDARWAVRVPLMVGVQTGGFKLELGPELKLPLQGSYSYALTDGEVDAYLVNQDVHIYNDPAMGMFPAAGTDGKGNLTIPRMALSAAVALGYEWQFGRSSRLGSRSRYAIPTTNHVLSVQLYAEYPVWQTERMSLPAFTLWATAVPAPVVMMPQLTAPLTFGVRVAYTIFPGSGKQNGCVCER